MQRRGALVIRNDERPWREIEALDFDNIVISPGPGRPQRPTDLGISAEALRQARVPVLGVCLGHQAMAHHCGATVARATRPMHGRLDRVHHAATGLFRGIPDHFEVVRYHSLAVTDLPAELEALAWAADGTLMALRHIRRPWWGVQFHPESICTEYGARLLNNFRELTLAWRSHRRPASTMGSFLPEFSLGKHAAVQVHARCLDVLPDPEQVFDALFAQATTSFWLDSSLTDTTRARFSFMGDASGPLGKRVIYRASGKDLEIRTHGTVDRRVQSIFDYLREQLPPPRPAPAPLPFDFAGASSATSATSSRQSSAAERAPRRNAGRAVDPGGPAPGVRPRRATDMGALLGRGPALEGQRGLDRGGCTAAST